MTPKSSRVFEEGSHGYMSSREKTYQDFLEQKRHYGENSGFKPLWMPSFLYDFQSHLVQWAIEKGRGAIFADCGLGKTPMQLVWAENVLRKTNKPVLILTPLSVSYQTLSEANKFDIDAHRSVDGKHEGKRIIITNYERLQYFNSSDFSGVVCDESSVLKNFKGSRQRMITGFMKKIPYRLLCTATASPNDYIELGTSSEALGQLGRMDMLAQFFKNDENSLHPIWHGARWRFKPHAEQHFWRWVCSWARACRRPEDLGYDGSRFALPPLTVNETTVSSDRPLNGCLFVLPAVGLKEQREERRLTLQDRCEEVARKVDHDQPAVVWCHLNAEADLLEKIIRGGVQVSGSHSDELKEERFSAFSSGDLRVLITKPKIGAFGMNWQHCAHVTMFPSHSFEQYYQAVRRCWRFGQKKPVTVDIVTTEGEQGVLKNLLRKADNADKMFTSLVREMNTPTTITPTDNHNTTTEVPSWL